MLRFLADENFRNTILRGLRRKHPNFDVVRVQDTHLYGSDDPAILEWAAQERRILLTHDARTVPRFAYARLREGKPMAGVLVVQAYAPVQKVVEDILLVEACMTDQECAGQVQFLPL